MEELVGETGCCSFEDQFESPSDTTELLELDFSLKAADRKSGLHNSPEITILSLLKNAVSKNL